MPHDDHPDLLSFEDVARDYLRKHGPRLDAEMAWFACQSLELLDAIERSCASVINGRVHSHQQRPFGIRPKAPKEAAGLLKQSANEIGAAGDFECLHTVIRAKLATVKGIGALGYYDIARRIGEWRRPKLEPTEVYLHQGTREGAKALRLALDRGRVPIGELPEGLRSLTPAQAEDALCIYRVPLERIASNGQGGLKTGRRGIVRCGVYPAHPRAPKPGRC